MTSRATHQIDADATAQSPSKKPRIENKVTKSVDTEKIVENERGESSRRGKGRKSKACFHCRKMKLKCEVLPGDRKCQHCSRRKVECVFRPTYFTSDSETSPLVESIDRYEKKIDTMREEIQKMRHSLDTVIQERKPPTTSPERKVSVQDASTETPESMVKSNSILSKRGDNTQMAMTRENSSEPTPQEQEDHIHGAVTVEEPMSSLYEVTRLRNIRSNMARHARLRDFSVDTEGYLDDFISRGVISEYEAEDLHRTFTGSLNHYLWVGIDTDFHNVRVSSELLTATILTVTALHIPSRAETFDRCYKEFLGLISSSMFSRYHSVDDIRGLVIAAFWLSDASWKLSGHAIRIATELNIHQSFSRALAGDREHFVRARLWYMLYVCDHHFSVAYGRPPMIAESKQIREHELFLASPLAEDVDARILSQVALMQILTKIYDRFSEPRLPDIELMNYYTTHGGPLSHGMLYDSSSMMMLTEDDFVDVRNFNLEIEQWRMRWFARQKPNRFIGTFPPKGIILYSYFAKLQLNVLAVRGVSLDSGKLSTERKEFTNMAISAATSILTFVLEEEDMRRALVGTPLYVHTMITFACVFLMKMTTKWHRIMGFNMENNYLNVMELLERIIVLLESSVTSDRHVLHHISAGLKKMMTRMSVDAETEAARAAAAMSFQPGPFQHQHQSAGTGYLMPNLMSQSFEMAVPESSSSSSTSHFTDEVDWAAYGQTGADFVGEGPAIMDASLLYEAFGTQSASDVYSFLTSHFS